MPTSAAMSYAGWSENPVHACTTGRWRNLKYACPLRPQMYQSISLPSSRSVTARRSASFSTLEE